MPHRSYLFVPADRPERYPKALATGAHAVIVDLEDAVAPDAKERARAALCEWLEGGGEGVLVRINAVSTPWFEEDLALCSRAGVAGVLVPKAERPPDLLQIAGIAAGKPLYPLIESAAGFQAAAAIAGVAGVERLMFGSIDFQADVGIDGDGEELLVFRSGIVLASRLAGIGPPVDGVSTAIDDLAALQADVTRARKLGFGAKLCIHPRQVATVNALFLPTPAEVKWARRVVDAARRANGAAVAVDGRMVDKPVVRKAEAIIAEAKA